MVMALRQMIKDPSLAMMLLPLLPASSTYFTPIFTRMRYHSGPVGTSSDIASKSGFLDSHDSRKDKKFHLYEGKGKALAFLGNTDLFTFIREKINKKEEDCFLICTHIPC